MLGLPSNSAKWRGAKWRGAKWLSGGVIALGIVWVALGQNAKEDPKPADDDPFALPADKPADKPTDKPADKEKPEGGETGKPTSPEVALTDEITGMTRMTPPKEMGLWMDVKRKLVVLDGEVVMREGLLEMFACPKGTKEHESVIVTTVKPSFVNAALIALGIKHGSGVKFDPKYVPATGPIIDVFVMWKDSDGKEHRARAQDWIKSLKTEKAMEFDFVYAGSGTWVDEDTGEKHFQADGGDFICVSNFPTAMLDLPVASSQSNDALNFTAFTENIPPKGTKVRLVLKPREVKAEEGKDTPKDAAPTK